MTSESPTHPDAPADPRSHYNAAPIDRNVQQLLASLNLATGDFDARIRVALHELKDRRDADATRLLFSTHPDAPRAGGETPDILAELDRYLDAYRDAIIAEQYAGPEDAATDPDVDRAWERANKRREALRASLLERHRDGERAAAGADLPMILALADECDVWGHADWAARLREIAMCEPGLPPDESPQRNAVCDALTEALLYLGRLAYEANERTTVDLRDEGHVRGLARLLTVRDSEGRDGSLGENTRDLWTRIGKALVSAPPSPERASK